MGRKKGGKVVAEGSYGCVVTPPPKCTQKLAQNTAAVTSKSKKTVAKIYGDANNMRDEWDLSMKVAQMDRDGRWSIPVYESCAVRVGDLEREDRDNCDITKTLDDNAAVTYITMEYGGASLEDLIRNDEVISIKEFLLIMETCLLAVIMMLQRGYMHLDIKPGNVLYDAKHGRCYLIDFSLMQRIKDEFYTIDNHSIFEYAYMWYPPEFYLASRAMNVAQLSNITSQELRNRFERVYGRHGFLTNLELGIMVAEANDAIAGLQSHPPLTSLWQILDDKLYKSKVDIFSLGMTLKELYVKCVEEDMDSVADLLDGMVSANVFSRIRPHDAYSTLSKILQKRYRKHTLLEDPPSVAKSAVPPLPHVKDLTQSSKRLQPITAAFKKLFRKKPSS